MVPWRLLAPCVSVLGIAACSGSDSTSGGSGASGAVTSASGAGGSSSPSGGAGGAGGAGGVGSSTGGAGGAGGAVDCAKEPDTAKCHVCCDKQTGGYAAYVTALLLACGCDPGQGPAKPSPCLGSCDTSDPNTDVCTGNGMVSPAAFNANMACSSCMNALAPGEMCFGSVTAKCDASCKAYVGCVQTSCN